MFLRRSTVGREPLAVTMSGVRMGERVLQIGVDDPAITGVLAAKTGITGQASIVVADEAQAARARSAAAEAAALADVHAASFQSLPFGEDGFDAVIVHTVNGLLSSMPVDVRDAVLRDCRRVLRRGGRIIVLEAGTPTGLRGLFSATPKRRAEYEADGGTVSALRAAGFTAARELGDRQGYRFIEGLKT